MVWNCGWGSFLPCGYGNHIFLVVVITICWKCYFFHLNWIFTFVRNLLTLYMWLCYIIWSRRNELILRCAKLFLIFELLCVLICIPYWVETGKTQIQRETVGITEKNKARKREKKVFCVDAISNRIWYFKKNKCQGRHLWEWDSSERTGWSEEMNHVAFWSKHVAGMWTKSQRWGHACHVEK